MSYWTHSICRPCWDILRPRKEPVIFPGAGLENCCFCGQQHTSGIYMREAPAGLWCKGEKGIHVNDTK